MTPGKSRRGKGGKVGGMRRRGTPSLLGAWGCESSLRNVDPGWQPEPTLNSTSTIFFFHLSRVNGHTRCEFFPVKTLNRHFMLASILKGQNSASIHSGYPIVAQSISGLWEPYRSERFYYEVVECGRRIMLTGVVVLFFPDDAAQIAITMRIAFCSYVRNIVAVRV